MEFIIKKPIKTWVANVPSIEKYKELLTEYRPSACFPNNYKFICDNEQKRKELMRMAKQGGPEYMKYFIFRERKFTKRIK